MRTTNYFDTFIAVSDDCPANAGEMPPAKGNARTAASIQYEMVSKHPYRYSSDDVLFQCFAQRHALKGAAIEKERAAFFSKGQPCLRSSPLVKRYGWGVHSDAKVRIALYGVGTVEYDRFLGDRDVKVLRGMRSSRQRDRAVPS